MRLVQAFLEPRMSSVEFFLAYGFTIVICWLMIRVWNVLVCHLTLRKHWGAMVLLRYHRLDLMGIRKL